MLGHIDVILSFLACKGKAAIATKLDINVRVVSVILLMWLVCEDGCHQRYDL